MAVNKVDINGETVIDLTSDTVTADTLAEGITAHSSDGEPIVGRMVAGAGKPYILPTASADTLGGVKAIRCDHYTSDYEFVQIDPDGRLIVDYGSLQPKDYIILVGRRLDFEDILNMATAGTTVCVVDPDTMQYAPMSRIETIDYIPHLVWANDYIRYKYSALGEWSIESIPSDNVTKARTLPEDEDELNIVAGKDWGDGAWLALRKIGRKDRGGSFELFSFGENGADWKSLYGHVNDGLKWGDDYVAMTSDIPSDEHINSLIDAKLAPLEALANEALEVIG